MTDKSFIGKGKMFLDGRFVGDVSALAISIEDERVELADYTQPGGGLYNSVRRVSNVAVTMTLHDYSADNLAMAVYGEAGINAGATVTDEAIAVGASLGMLITTASMIDTTQAVTVTTDPAGTTYVAGTDYELSAAGIITLATGNISASEALLITYTGQAGSIVQALINTAAEHELVFDGLNEAQGESPVVVKVFRAKFGGAEELPMIGDEFAALELSGDVLKDDTKNGTDESQYFTIAQA